MNVPYPGFSRPVGFAVAVAVMAVAALVLYVIFRRKGWL
jgi:magnesium transporter